MVAQLLRQLPVLALVAPAIPSVQTPGRAGDRERQARPSIEPGES